MIVPNTSNMLITISCIASAAIAILGRTCSCLEFTYPNFNPSHTDDFSFSPGSSIANGSLQITPNTGNMSHRSGRVVYARETLKLWNSKRTALTSFRTEFVLNILPQNGAAGEGMAFVLTNNPSLPSNSSGQWLGVFNSQTDGAFANRVVAVEFDTRKSYEEDLDDNHVGIDIDSIKSVSQIPLSNQSVVLSSGSDVWVRVEYNGTSLLFQVTLIQYSTSGTHVSVLAGYINLSLGLLDDIYLVFAASTGDFTQLNQIKSWNFTTVDDDVKVVGAWRKVLLALGTLIIFSICLFAVLFVWRKLTLTRQTRLGYRKLEQMIDAHGAVKFKLKELRRATANFSPTRKLGRGGFGTVYLGYIDRMSLEVAVKRVSTTDDAMSDRGEQEFVAEVNTIGRLSHRNLVKLIGWCHEGSELLLVYEYFPMGSLDKLLYASARSRETNSSLTTSALELTWEWRYRIICSVASALDYLHHGIGSGKTILHRDLKASNVMLDDDCNARLGGFGLARVIQHDGVTHHSTSTQAEEVAGTRGYMAYESFFTGRASLDTDVYAFGVLVMEVISGRSPSSSVSYRNQDEAAPARKTRLESMYLVDWIWRHYGEGKIFSAADTVLGGVYNEAQVDCAVRLALACCHPNPRERPSMRTAVQVLIGGASAPDPPIFKPAFVWPPSGKQPEIDLPHVGVLFTGGFCS